MHKRTLIRNAHIVNEGRTYVGSVTIDGDRIEEVIEGRDCSPIVPPDETIEADGLWLLPGIIDTHVHFREPGMTAKGDFESESRAAIAGGVTTVLDMPNVKPATTTPEALAEKMALARKKCHVNYGFYYGATADNAGTLAHLNPREVCAIKLFMGSSTGNLLVEDAQALHTIFAQSRLPIVVHCEDTALVERNMAECRATEGADPDIHFHSVVRDDEVCYRSTKQAVELALATGARLHVAHVSTARELRLLSSKAGNGQITAEACLPHLLFTTDDYAKRHAYIKCNPAVKSAKDRDALRRALTTGVVTTVGTDHAPHLLREKQGGAARALSGMPLIQFSLPAMLDLVSSGVLTLPRLAALMCHGPADTFSIEGRGYIRAGYKADLVLVRPRQPWTLTPNHILSKCGWSPLEGHTFGWRVEKTWCNGYLLYNNGHLTDESFIGQMITYNRH